MNRKNTILIAVIINAGLLAVLLVAALTMQDDLPIESHLAQEAPMELDLPKFNDAPAYQEIAQLALLEAGAKPAQTAEIVHELPPMISEPASVQIVAEPPSAPAAPAPLHASIQEVVVKKGDSLEKLAKNHRTTVNEIVKLNHLSSTFLKVGQILKMPTEKSGGVAIEKKTVAPNPEYYTMKVGESPWAIAKKHHMKVEELLKLNGLNEEKARKLKPGDRLRIR